MTIVLIRKTLLKELKSYGIIDWHKSLHDSRYIKFRDCRLGSIRIANHPGRQKYNYTYEISTDDENIEDNPLPEDSKYTVADMRYDLLYSTGTLSFSEDVTQEMLDYIAELINAMT